MVYLYYSHFDHQWSDEDFQKAIQGISNSEKTKIARFVRWQDRQSGVLGKLLLKYGLKQLTSRKSLEEIKYNKYGKPYFLNGPYFNISHSGNYVICILSMDTEVGIDIEEVKRINVSDFESVFTKDEWKLVEEDQEQWLIFYDLWTRKEAVIKAQGSGLSIPLIKVEAINNPINCKENDWFVHPIDLDPNYKCSFATSQPCIFKIEKTDFLNLNV